MRYRTHATTALLVTAALVLTGCGGTEDSPEATSSSAAAPTSAPPATQESPEPQGDDATSAPADEPAEPVEITISSFTYDVPATVAPGETIMVTNEDEVLHTVTADDGAFDVDVPAGATVELTVPDEPGSYPFFCEPHPYMTATLVVG